MRRLIIPALVLGAFLAGAVAHAQVSTWGWWGSARATVVPISATNPLPVTCI